MIMPGPELPVKILFPPGNDDILFYQYEWAARGTGDRTAVSSDEGGVGTVKLLFVEYGGLRSDNGLNLATVELIRLLSGDAEIDLASVCAGENDRQTPLPPGIRYHLLLKGDRRIRQTLPAFRPMLRLLRENRYDWIVLQGNGCLTAVLPAARLTGTGMLYVDHAVMDPAEKRDAFYWERRLEGRVCRAVITQTEASRQAYLKTFRLPPDRVFVIHNTVPSYAGPLCTPERTELVSVLRMAPEKRPELIVPIAAALRERAGTFVWRVWGTGPLEEQLRADIEENGLTEQVIQMGTSPDKDRLYDRAGALVLTSRYEGWGMVLSEARSRGIPCFAFDVPYGPGAQIRDVVSGALVKPWDCEQMADRLAAFLRNREIRESMMTHAPEGLEECSPEAVRRDWLNMLARVSEVRM